MILRCMIAYTAPDGEVFAAGELYSVEPELGMWLLTAAAGQFAVEDANADDVAGPLDAPPADRQVGRPPLGGSPPDFRTASSAAGGRDQAGGSPRSRKR